MPCAHPVYFTASGMPAKYLRGMAIPINTSREIPSAIPIFRKSGSDDDILQRNDKDRLCVSLTESVICRINNLYAFSRPVKYYPERNSTRL